jgi:hypothetical protein
MTTRPDPLEPAHCAEDFEEPEEGPDVLSPAEGIMLDALVAAALAKSRGDKPKKLGVPPKGARK